MNHDENSFGESNNQADLRLKELLNRIPNREEFISELEDFVDEVYPEDKEPRSKGLQAFISLLILLVAVASISFKFYYKFKNTQPVSFEKLIKLHSKEMVTTEILVKYMYAQPFGDAIKPIIKLADSGNVDAQNITCWAYLDGLNVEKRPDLVVKYCNMASEQGHHGAQMNLGHHYYTDEENFDLDNAIKYYSKAAKYRWNAAWTLSYIYENFPPPIRNFEQAVHYKKIAAELGYSHAMISLGDDYFKARLGLKVNNELALKYYKLAEKAGHVDAHAWLAMFYQDAKPPFQDYQKMNEHLKKAMVQDDHPTAYRMLGDAYRDGRGVEKNFKTAIKYYAFGAERDDKYMIFQLAHLHSLGQIKEGDLGYGFKYKNYILPYAVRNTLNYRDKIGQVLQIIHNENTNPVLRTKIFEYYADGMLGDHEHGAFPIDYTNTFYFGTGHINEFQPLVKAYEIQASRGSGRHAYQLGLIYMSGGGVVRNPKKSMEWISKALDAGHPDVQNYAGNYLSTSDEFVQRESKFARETLQKAAALGSAHAAQSLGSIYLDGAGVEIDKVSAMYWYTHANLGNLPQGETLYAIKKTMSLEEVSKAKSLMENCKKSEFFKCLNTL